MLCNLSKNLHNKRRLKNKQEAKKSLTQTNKKLAQPSCFQKVWKIALILTTIRATVKFRNICRYVQCMYLHT